MFFYDDDDGVKMFKIFLNSKIISSDIINERNSIIFVEHEFLDIVYILALNKDFICPINIITTKEYNSLMNDFKTLQAYNNVSFHPSLRRKKRFNFPCNKELYIQIKDFKKKIGKKIFDNCKISVFNSRYKININSAVFLVNLEDLDDFHFMFRLKSLKSFTKGWKEFIKRYKEHNLKELLKKNTWARQHLITFLVKFNKLNLLNNKKYYWILEQTKQFYFHGIKLRKTIINDPHCGRLLKLKKINSDKCELLKPMEDAVIREGLFEDVGPFFPCKIDNCIFHRKTRVYYSKIVDIYGSLNDVSAFYDILILNKPRDVTLPTNLVFSFHDLFPFLKMENFIGPSGLIYLNSILSNPSSKISKDEIRKILIKNSKYFNKFIQHFKRIRKINPHYESPLLNEIINLNNLNNSIKSFIEKFLISSF